MKSGQRSRSQRVLKNAPNFYVCHCSLGRNFYPIALIFSQMMGIQYGTDPIEISENRSKVKVTRSKKIIFLCQRSLSRNFFPNALIFSQVIGIYFGTVSIEIGENRSKVKVAKSKKYFFDLVTLTFDRFLLISIGSVPYWIPIIKEKIRAIG